MENEGVNNVVQISGDEIASTLYEEGCCYVNRAGVRCRKRTRNYMEEHSGYRCYVHKGNRKKTKPVVKAEATV